MKLTNSVLAMGLVALGAVACTPRDGSVTGTTDSDQVSTTNQAPTTAPDSAAPGTAPSTTGDAPLDDMSATRDSSSGATTAPGSDVGSESNKMSSSKKDRAHKKSGAKSGAAVGIPSQYREGHEFAVITFKKGTSELTDSAKEELRSLVREANAAGIEDIHVAVWSDKSFPKNNVDLPEKDRELASQRIDTLNTYLKDSLEVSDVDSYNMAEKSNFFSRAFNTKDADLKSMFTEAGAPANVEPQEFVIVQKKGGPSKAVILIQPLEASQAAAPGSSSSGTTIAPVPVVEESSSETVVEEPSLAEQQMEKDLARTDDFHGGARPYEGEQQPGSESAATRGSESGMTLPPSRPDDEFAPTLDDFDTMQDPIGRDGEEFFERPSTNLSD